MRIYVFTWNNRPLNFPPDPIWNEGALGLFEEEEEEEQQQQQQQQDE